MQSILKFHNELFIDALKAFFAELKVPVNYLADAPASPAEVLGEKFKAHNEAHKLITDVYVLGLIDNAIFDGQKTFANLAAVKQLRADYDGLLLFGITLNTNAISRSHLAEITRAVNRAFPYTPVTIVFKYGNLISLANSERIKYKQQWREGEKIGKVTMLKDVDATKPHAAHLKILAGLTINLKKIDSFQLLYNYWQSVFSLKALNNQFYADLQNWFYYASQNIKLPFKPTYINDKENIKNFLVRLLARTMFCWFVKEKGLIQNELLELTDWQENKYNLTHDIESEKFLNSNSYYRGILQNIFFNALNQKEKKTAKDFGWTKYWHPNLKLDWLTHIPYLNGGIFDKLDEDNAKESIEDSVISIPNFLFYGKPNEINAKGLNKILKSYKFTLDENTPFEEDIALDPEMLGLVFENLLAELDPNLEESAIKSIRKQTGSYYTPRKVIFEMVNDSLNLYLSKFIAAKYPTIDDIKTKVNDLVHYNSLQNSQPEFEKAVVEALDQYKVLDPACGSGAFPMGMLHRMVDMLKLVDNQNEKWIELKLKNVDKAQRAEFKKVLTSHLDDYGRKLGIIRDSIYGIDIQPLAVQITKLRFFISLLIDQKTTKGITPMPNIETKIICADSLKNIKADLFSTDAVEKLIDARTRYYQPDISQTERRSIADEIVTVLDIAFPSFAFQVTGKRIEGQNKELIRHWFTHGALAAPFFNMDFFYPELTETGGFDCIIGNPPYGGVKISDDVRTALDIDSKDPYGAFIARFMQRNTDNTPKITPLKHGGVLAYIVSDTFMTIKSHLKLRKHLMQNYVHKMLRVHPDTFNATVNTVIMIAERNTQKDFDDKHICLMADFTNISVHEKYEHFVEVLNLTKGVDFETTSANIANPEYAIYYYPQALIKTNSNLPFFVASPKLFALMNDSGNDSKEIGGKQVQVKSHFINNKHVSLLKLESISEIKRGMDTGKNEEYLYQNTKARGNYSNINTVLNFIISPEELFEICKDDNTRKKIIKQGFALNKSDKTGYYYNGKHIIPFDKGGESDAENGFIPNYYVATDYFIDWSNKSVKSLYERSGYSAAKANLRNPEYWLVNGITYSARGVYSPSYRLNSCSVFDSNGSSIFPIKRSPKSTKFLLSIISSRLLKFFLKNYCGHTIASEVDELKELPIELNYDKNNLLIENINSIIQAQKTNPRYDYASHEQLEIDKLVYEAYGLNAEDVKEVENWYARRYPKLSAAQKANLRALGKSDDYLQLYGLK